MFKKFLLVMLYVMVIIVILIGSEYAYNSISANTSKDTVIFVDNRSLELESKLKKAQEREKEFYIDWMYRNSSMPRRLLKSQYDEFSKYELKNILIAIARVESRFDPHAISKAGAKGLMQVLPKIWTKKLKEEGSLDDERDLFLIDISIKSGHRIFVDYLDSSKTIEEALTKYVGGDKSYAGDVLKTLGKIEVEKLLFLNRKIKKS